MSADFADIYPLVLGSRGTTYQTFTSWREESNSVWIGDYADLDSARAAVGNARVTVHPAEVLG